VSVANEQAGPGAGAGPQLLLGEEIAEEPPLVQLLSDVQRRVAELRERYGPTLLRRARRRGARTARREARRRAFDRVRAARAALTRIELRPRLDAHVRP
jgi:ribosomal protein L19E